MIGRDREGKYYIMHNLIFYFLPERKATMATFPSGSYERLADALEVARKEVLNSLTIAEIKNLDMLYAFLIAHRTVQGSQRTYEAKEIIDIIEYLRSRGEAGRGELTKITNALGTPLEGLRGKVGELLVVSRENVDNVQKPPREEVLKKFVFGEAVILEKTDILPGKQSSILPGSIMVGFLGSDISEGRGIILSNVGQTSAIRKIGRVIDAYTLELQTDTSIYEVRILTNITDQIISGERKLEKGDILGKNDFNIAGIVVDLDPGSGMLKLRIHTKDGVSEESMHSRDMQNRITMGEFKAWRAGAASPVTMEEVIKRIEDGRIRKATISGHPEGRVVQVLYYSKLEGRGIPGGYLMVEELPGEMAAGRITATRSLAFPDSLVFWTDEKNRYADRELDTLLDNIFSGQRPPMAVLRKATMRMSDALNNKYTDRNEFQAALQRVVESLANPEARAFYLANLSDLVIWRNKDTDAFGISVSQGVALLLEEERENAEKPSASPIIVVETARRLQEKIRKRLPLYDFSIEETTGEDIRVKITVPANSDGPAAIFEGTANPQDLEFKKFFEKLQYDADFINAEGEDTSPYGKTRNNIKKSLRKFGTYLASSPMPATDKKFIKGGIDLNPVNLNLQIKRDGNGVPLPVEFQDIPNINVNGFVPVIINITPVTNLPLLLGTNTNPQEQQLSSVQ